MSAGAAKILQELCSVPTAPFVEDRVAQYVRGFVNARPRLGLTSDAFGNLLILLPGTSRNSTARWVFTAHMDHPGFVARKMLNAKTLLADFRGGVDKRYFPKAQVRLFEDDREISATVIRCKLDEEGRPNAAELRIGQPVIPGTLGMWDVGIGRIKGRKFFSRVCDDLAGAAAALAMLDALWRRPPKATIALLLTRGEEEGFIGAIAASQRPKLLRKTDRLIAIECSPEQPHAPQGAGAIIRVGDRVSTFHSGLTYFLNQTAADLSKRDRHFRYQRALMAGGACEATVYNLYGLAAASICVPLGNYHNMDKTRKKIAPEYIDLNDWQSMVKLFVAVARNAHSYQPGDKALKQRIEKRYQRWRRLLK